VERDSERKGGSRARPIALRNPPASHWLERRELLQNSLETKLSSYKPASLEEQDVSEVTPGPRKRGPKRKHGMISRERRQRVTSGNHKREGRKGKATTIEPRRSPLDTATEW
jgi:hypothetical protein